MKAKQENEAEIALDVRTATRARAESEIRKDEALKIELAKELRIKKKVRKEKLATFYYNLATLFVTSSGIGGLTPVLTNEDKPINWYGLIIGLFLALYFAFQANKELKY